jgi:hypothetical protein
MVHEIEKTPTARIAKLAAQNYTLRRRKIKTSQPYRSGSNKEI